MVSQNFRQNQQIPRKRLGFGDRLNKIADKNLDIILENKVFQELKLSKNANKTFLTLVFK